MGEFDAFSDKVNRLGVGSEGHCYFEALDLCSPEDVIFHGLPVGDTFFKVVIAMVLISFNDSGYVSWMWLQTEEKMEEVR